MVIAIAMVRRMTALFLLSSCFHARSRAGNSMFTLAMSTAAKLNSYDVIVIGGGSAGLTAAKLAGNTLGKKCIIIEADRMGGDCTWTGCVPSKSFIAAAKSMHAAKQYGLVDANAKADFTAIKQKLQANIQQIYDEDDSPEALAKLGIEVVKGRAVLLTDKTIQITTANVDSTSTSSFELEAKEGIILCTGASPRIPNIKGLSDCDYSTYENVWDLDKLPNRLTVVGGGPIACELSQAFQRLGSQVTIVANKILPREDPAVGKILEDVFKSEGITIVKGRVTEVNKDTGSGASHIASCDSGDQVTGDMLLLATGRVPRCSGMGFENVGLELTDNQAGIAVNEKLQTTVKGIYAAGDCTGDRQFTHYAGYQGAIAARNIILPLSDPGVLENVPATTFTSPEIASIGLDEAAASEKYGADKIVVLEEQLSNVDRAVCDGAQNGFIKIIYLKKSGKVLGATIVAPVAGEMISEIAVIMKTGLPFDQLATVMHPYPTYAMALQLMAAEPYYEKTLKLKWVMDIMKKIGL